MKHLEFKKIKIAKINNLNTITGGNLDTIAETCVEEYTRNTCPLESNNPYTCPTTTNEGTKTLGFAETDTCGG